MATMNKPTFYKYLKLGHYEKQLRQRKESLEKVGILRGGNSSALYYNKVIGINPKETLLRYLGMEMPIDFDSMLLLDAGFLNETAYESLLTEAGIKFKAEEEIPVEWFITTKANTGKVTTVNLNTDIKLILTDSIPSTLFLGKDISIESSDGSSIVDGTISNIDIGTDQLTVNISDTSAFTVDDVVSVFRKVKVTGRPDCGILDKINDKLALILEHKQIASTWKTKELSHWGMGQPKPENVVQTAHYSWIHGNLPAVLVYCSRAWHALKTKKDLLLQPDHRALLGDEYTWGVKPFMTLYDVTWDSNNLLFEGKKTAIKPDGIKEYYELIANCAESKTIPQNYYVDIWGKPMNKKKREKYYDWAHIPEEDYEEWVELIQNECDLAWQEVEQKIKELEAELID